MSTGTESVIIEPVVDVPAEFKEIAGDFGDPFEIIREAISNSVDADADEIKITISVQTLSGKRKLVIEIEDNGKGMNHETLTKKFWGLGLSDSRQDKEKIGQKGHGTKIYLRSDHIFVRTYHENGAYESSCANPWADLSEDRLHQPSLTKIGHDPDKKGTYIKVIGYNEDESSAYLQIIVKDYIYWFTKFGSIEKEFDINKYSHLKLHLKCIDVSDYEILDFGHKFPEINDDVNKLFEQETVNAADYYVRKFIYKDIRLEDRPEIKYDMVIYVEGDQAKRSYNKMLKSRAKSIKGKYKEYKVSDRYGIWLCKDFIPIQNVNEWISGFGTGSNSFTLLHGFINCQDLSLTANRGSVKNTSMKTLDEIKKEFSAKLQDIDLKLRKEGIFYLLKLQSEHLTLEQENEDFKQRMKTIRKKAWAKLDSHKFYEPSNESELYGLFISISTLRPELFEFEPLDYNTSRGIDLICRKKNHLRAVDAECRYVELKFKLDTSLNHGFQNLSYVLCWEFTKNIDDNCEIDDISNSDKRIMHYQIENGKHYYFLDSKSHKVTNRILVIKFKEFLNEHLGMTFEPLPNT